MTINLICNYILSTEYVMDYGMMKPLHESSPRKTQVKIGYERTLRLTLRNAGRKGVVDIIGYFKTRNVRSSRLFGGPF